MATVFTSLVNQGTGVRRSHSFNQSDKIYDSCRCVEKDASLNEPLRKVSYSKRFLKKYLKGLGVSDPSTLHDAYIMSLQDSFELEDLKVVFSKPVPLVEDKPLFHNRTYQSEMSRFYRGLRDTKPKKPDDSNCLGIIWTKSGMKTQADIDGIARKKREFSRKIKQDIARERRYNDRARDLSRRSSIIDDFNFNSSFSELSVSTSNPVLSLNPVQRIKDSSRLDFKKFIAYFKSEKKRLKHLRRSERITSESDVYCNNLPVRIGRSSYNPSSEFMGDNRRVAEQIIDKTLRNHYTGEPIKPFTHAFRVELYERARKLTQKFRNREIYSKNDWSFNHPRFKFKNSDEDDLKSTRLNYSEFTEEFSKLKEASPFLKNIPNLETVFDFSKMIYRILRSRSATELWLAIYDILSYCTSRSFVDRIMNSFSLTILGTAISSLFKLLQSERNDIRTESSIASDAIITFRDMYNSAVGGKIMVAIRNLIVTGIALQWISSSQAANISKYMKLPKKGEASYIELVDMVLEAVLKVVRIGELLISGVPFSEVLFSGNLVSANIKRGKNLLLWKDRVYNGLPVDHCMCIKQFITEAEEILATSEKLRKELNSWSNTHQECYELENHLKSAIFEHKQTVCREHRSPPIGIAVVGDPGIGKSNILNFICAVMSDVKDRPFEPNQIYHRVMSSQYWDGYSPYATPYVHYSEVGSDSESILKTRGDDTMNEMTSVIDAVPMILNMSDVKDKGKISMLAELVVLDTNSEDLGVPHYKNNVAAYYRRFLFIVPVVKAKYRQQGGTGIDQSRCDDGSRFMDRWTFDVYTCVPEGNKKYNRINHLVSTNPTHNIDALKVFLEGYFRKKLEQDASLQTSRHDLKLSDYGVPKPVVHDFNVSDICFDTKSNSSEEVLFDHKDSDTDEDVPLLYDRDEGSTRAVSESNVYNGCRTMCSQFDIKFPALLKRLWNCDATLLNPIEWTARNGSVLLSNTYSYITCSAVSSAINNFDVKEWKVNIFLCIVTFLLAFYMTGSSGMGIFFAAYYVADMELLTHGAFAQGVDNKKRKHLEKMKITSRKMSDYWHFKVSEYSWVPDSYVHTVCALTAVGGSIVLLRKLWKIFSVTSQFSESMTFTNRASSDPIIESVEKRMDCGISYERVPVKNTEKWNTVHSEFSPSHTSGVDDLLRKVRRNVRTCEVHSDVLGKSARTRLLGVSGCYAIINTHSLLVKEGKISLGVQRCEGDASSGFLVTVLTIGVDAIDIGGDITVIRLSGIQFKNILEHVSTSDHYNSLSKGFISDSYTAVQFYTKKLVIEDAIFKNIILDKYFSYQWKDHSVGRCGEPLICSHGSGFVIGGIHTAGSRESYNSYASPLNRNNIQRAIDALGLTLVSIKSESDYVVSKGFGPRNDIRLRSNINPRSFFNYYHLPRINYWGSIDKSVSIPKRSKLTRTLFSEDIDEIFLEHFGEIPSSRFGPPVMKPHFQKTSGGDQIYIDPYFHALSKMNKPRPSMDLEVLSEIAEELSLKIISNLEAKGIKRLKPVTFDCAVNGAPFDPFIRSVNANASSGFGWSGKKSKYLELVTEDTNEVFRRAPTQELREAVGKIYDDYSSGVSTNSIYTAQLKDEPRSVEKIISGKTRVFYMSELSMLIVQRMVLSPIYSLMVEHCDSFYCALGSDMHRDADALYSSLTNFSSNIMEGDYGGYDVSMPYEVGWTAATVVHNICSHFGYNEEALSVVRGVLTDNLFPSVDMCGELFTVPGLQPSGKYATAEDNSLRGIILLMYGWKRNPLLPRRSFFDCVLPLVYGDDMLAAVKEEYRMFNNNYYQRVCETDFGMTFTTASKSGDMEDFVHPDSMSFLKRVFVKYPRFNRRVAPLELSSLYKMLYWRLPSSSVTEEVQMKGALTSFLWESVFHLDRQKHNAVRSALLRVFSGKVGIPLDSLQGEFPTYNMLVSTLELTDSCSTPIAVREGRQHLYDDLAGGNDDTMYPSIASESEIKMDVDRVSGFCRPLPCNQWQANIQYYKDCITQLRTDLSRYESDLQKLYDPLPGATYHQMQLTQRYSSSPNFRRDVDDYYKAVSLVESTKTAIRMYERAVAMNSGIRTESEVLEPGAGIVDVSNMDVAQNLTDVMGDTPVYVDGERSRSMRQGQDASIELKDFLSRPIPIATAEWAVGDHLELELDPWDIFFLVPSVRAKLRNFAHIRATLNVRIALSGMPYHHGRLQVAYASLGHYNQPLLSLYDSFQVNPVAYRECVLSYLSQLPLSTSIVPRANKPVDMRLDYISPQPMARLFNVSSSALAATDSLHDLATLGKLYLTSYHRLHSTAVGSTGASIVVYAWLTDVELGCPTGTVMSITTESLVYDDERKTGPVQKIASRALSVTNALTQIPMIAPYAQASSIFLRGMRDMASLFGWSYPVLNAVPGRMKNEAYQNGCHTIGTDTGKRLTLEPTQELTVDPRTTGSTKDEMAIAYICSVESFLFQVPWYTGVTPLTIPLTSMAVCPTNYNKATDVNLMQPTALGFAATPFSYWRGDLNIRVEIDTSAFHRGKIAFVYEPNISQFGIIGLELNLNKQFVKVIDIQETQDFEFTINWASHRPWLRVPHRVDLNPVYETNFGPDLQEFCNGIFYVVPVTNLQSPADADPVMLRFFVSSPNMVFNTPSQFYLPSSLKPVTEADVYTSVPPAKMDLNISTATMGDIREEYFGEAPLSFRTLLKRFATEDFDDYKAPTTSQTLRCVVPNLPIPYPNYFTVQDGFSSVTSLYSYLRFAYLGVRGGIRRRTYVTGAFSNSHTDVWKVSLEHPEVAYSISSGVSTYDNLSVLDGTVSFVPTTNGGVEYEVPFYSNNLWAISFHSDAFPSSATFVDEKTPRSHQTLFVMSGTGSVRLHREIATGEDFSLFRFQAAPPVGW